MLNVLIVDDEPPAHEVLLHHCRAYPELKVVGQCYNAAQALAMAAKFPIDLMFLDVQMPQFGGLDLLRGLQSPPLTVIVSAHREHALEGYDLDVVDYLLKPVSIDRFAAAVEKAKRRLAAQVAQAGGKAEDLVLKVDRTQRRFRLDRISCFQAQGNFVKVWSDDAESLATVTLRQVIESLPGDRFVQVHKSFVVNSERIAEQRTGAIRLDTGMEVPIGRSYRNLGSLLSR